MTQTFYTHVNKLIKKESMKQEACSLKETTRLKNPWRGMVEWLK
jgi:hypothetical protein